MPLVESLVYWLAWHAPPWESCIGKNLRELTGRVSLPAEVKYIWKAADSMQGAWENHAATRNLSLPDPLGESGYEANLSDVQQLVAPPPFHSNLQILVLPPKVKKGSKVTLCWKDFADPIGQKGSYTILQNEI